MPETQTSFLCSFPKPPLGEGDHNSGGQSSLCFGTRSSPTPFCGNPKGPLFKGAFFKKQVDRLPTATCTCK